MSFTRWFGDLFAAPVDLSAEQAVRLETVFRRIDASAATGSVGARNARWVVADVESSGLDTSRDRLLAIGAVSVRRGAVVLGESLEVVLRQDSVSTHDNILIHRIDGRSQREGVDPVEALLGFYEYVDGAVLVGYHAPFDQAMIARATKHFLGTNIDATWLDLATLAPALVRDGELPRRVDALSAGRAARMQPLDWWLDHFSIRVSRRHNAAADALGTAQLLSVLLAADWSASRTVANLLKVANDYAWELDQTRL
jgi:DNA polymerase III subunit epsilon